MCLSSWQASGIFKCGKKTQSNPRSPTQCAGSRRASSAKRGTLFMRSKTICLNMIVKNESRVIQRCLDSVKHIIDYWVIVDTGSTDGTQNVIKDFMKDIPGDLYE